MYMCVITSFVTEGNTLVTKGLGDMKEDHDDKKEDKSKFFKSQEGEG